MQCLQILISKSGRDMFVANCNIYHAVGIVRRQVHSCPIMCSTVNKQAKTIAKLMTNSLRKKKNWFNAEMMAKISVLPANKKFQEGGSTKKRIDVLNKLFMRSITDLLATGEVAPCLIGHGISITKVKVISDFSTVNLYWTAKDATHSVELEKKLENAGFEIRHHLCQLHVMGKVPRICFVADKWQTIIEETSLCLERIKCKDGMPEDLAAKIKSDCVLDVPLTAEELAKIDELDIDDNPLAPMTHNILGLDHAAIMAKIERAVKKSEARHRQGSLNDDCMEKNVIEVSVRNYDIQPDIRKYIAKQKIEKKKMKRALQKELLARMEVIDKPKDEEYIDIDDGDFIEEFDVITKNYTKLRE